MTKVLVAGWWSNALRISFFPKRNAWKSAPRSHCDQQKTRVFGSMEGQVSTTTAEGGGDNWASRLHSVLDRVEPLGTFASMKIMENIKFPPPIVTVQGSWTIGNEVNKDSWDWFEKRSNGWLVPDTWEGKVEADEEYWQLYDEKYDDGYEDAYWNNCGLRHAVFEDTDILESNEQAHAGNSPGTVESWYYATAVVFSPTTKD